MSRVGTRLGRGPETVGGGLWVPGMTTILELAPVVPAVAVRSWRERLEEAIGRPGHAALSMLQGADPAGLDDYDRVLALQAWAACRNWLDAQLVSAVVAVAGLGDATDVVSAPTGVQGPGDRGGPPGVAGVRGLCRGPGGELSGVGRRLPPRPGRCWRPG